MISSDWQSQKKKKNLWPDDNFQYVLTSSRGKIYKTNEGAQNWNQY